MKNRSAFSFVLIIGIVNLFADLTYEGARGIVGPFLGSLGASAAIVGFVAGFGELMGYALRSVSGYFADKTHKYWAVAFTGYAINMLAVPALAPRGTMAGGGGIGRGRTHRPGDPKTCGRSDAFARGSIDRSRLGVRPKRSARSSRRGHIA